MMSGQAHVEQCCGQIRVLAPPKVVEDFTKNHGRTAEI